MPAGIIILIGLAVASGLLLGWLRCRRGKPQPSAEQIDALLPQTQCGRCGYSACRPYAEAIARGEADINQCPPGGDFTIRELANLLGRKPKPLNPEHGAAPTEPIVAWIDETACIGCTRCIQACPVDAILGAAKQMHTVIRSECTGCALCVEPCPVDCIHMQSVTQHDHVPPASSQRLHLDGRSRSGFREQYQRKADLARERYENRMARLARERDERQRRQQRKKAMPRRDLDNTDKKAVIQAAVERARRRQATLAAKRDTAPASGSE